MASLHIPASHRPGFLALKNLPEAAFASLLDALERSEPYPFQSDLVRQAAAKNGLDGATPEDILRSVLTVLSVGRRQGWAPDEVASRVVASDALALAVEDQATLKGRLEKLFSARSVYITVKAADLLQEAPKAYCDSRIITDVRPVFADPDIGVPEYAVVVHSLRVEYHEADQMNSTSIAIDPRQLHSLRLLIDRALAKEQALVDVLGRSNMTLLQRPPGEGAGGD